MNIVQSIKCAIGIHSPVTFKEKISYKTRTTNKGRAKKRYRTTMIRVYETYCRHCGKLLKRSKNVKW